MVNESVFGSTFFAFAVERPGKAIVKAQADGWQCLWVSGNEEALCPANGPYLHYGYHGPVSHRDFFAELPGKLKAKGYKSLSIRLPPTPYHTWIEEVATVLRTFRQVNEVQDCNYHLPVRDTFSSSLPSDQRRVLRRAEDAGYKCRFSTDWAGILKIVSESRLRKGFSDAISLDLLLKLVKTFPNHYQGIICYQLNEICGSGILIRVDSRIAYLFYVANHPDHLAYSPSLQIIDFCISWALEQGLELVDLGTASKDGVVNEGVKLFKESIGGVLSTKSLFRLML